MPKLIIFDCDGTLIDSQHLIVEAMGAAFVANGLAAPAASAVLRHVGLSLPEVVGAITGSRDEALLASLAATYKDAFTGLRQRPSFAEPMYPGAHGALVTLGAEPDVVLGIATGKSRRGVDRFLEREALGDLFATIQTADDAPSKPHPAMVLRAMEETGASPADTVMIGDTSYDILMARSAGVPAIGVAWGYHTAEELVEAGAAEVALDYAHLMALLGKGHAEAA